MDKSTTHQTEVITSPVSLSDEGLVFSPTLVLSGDKSQNSEAQYLAKPGAELISEETEVGPMDVSPTIFERLFEGDLPERKGPESCILTAGAKLVVVQSLASLRGDTQPTLLDQELRSPDQVPHRIQLVFDQTLISLGVENYEEEEEELQLRWRSRGVRGTNSSQIRGDELETAKMLPKHVSPATCGDNAEARKRKGKGKLIKAHLKGEKKRYGTRSVTQKVLGSAMEANAAHTEIIRKRRQEGSLAVEPTYTIMHVDDSETQSEDIVRAVAKQKREAEEERVKSKGTQKRAMKSPAKKEKVTKQKNSKRRKE
ncbi:hypothetical protein H5410_055767 [Solanum commersonii]|uniref:Uncharacterized protein n=1 Tax=Solanum commersonii TaxID=4109 RepID=A0A9J5WIG5_SOLCO|nr:hypothetical protein H5410_055767 [Solanum commersonii]